MNECWCGSNTRRETNAAASIMASIIIHSSRGRWLSYLLMIINDVTVESLRYLLRPTMTAIVLGKKFNERNELGGKYVMRIVMHNRCAERGGKRWKMDRDYPRLCFRASERESREARVTTKDLRG